MTQTAATPDEDLSEEIAEVKSAIDAADATDAPANDDMRLVYRVLRIRAIAQAEHDRVKSAMDKVLAQQVRRVAAIDHFYAAHVAEVVSRELKGKRAKSIKTPFGDVGFRAHAAAVVIVNEKKLPEEFWRAKTDFVVDKVKLNEHFKETGEVPEGCDIQPGGDKFFMKT